MEASDHVFVLGHVLQLEHAPEESEAKPLVFFRGKLGDFRMLS